MDGNSNTTPQATESETRALAEIIGGLQTPKTITVKGQKGFPDTEILLLPEPGGGFNAHCVKPFLDPYRAAPEFRKGTAIFTDLQSIIDHTNRFKDAESALFAIDNRAAPSLIAVLDYHPSGSESAPRFCHHRGQYNFPLSNEFRAWIENDGQPMEQREFAEFLEDRIIDVMPLPDFLTGNDDADLSDADSQLKELVGKIGGRACGPARLMELAKGLRIHDAQTVKEFVNTSTGETQLKFESEHQDESGKPINVPNLFLIAIPAFHNGEIYRLPVRLRYRLRGGRISWSFTLHRPDLIQDHAFREACNQASTETGLPILFGTPEK